MVANVLSRAAVLGTVLPAAGSCASGPAVEGQTVCLVAGWGGFADSASGLLSFWRVWRGVEACTCCIVSLLALSCWSQLACKQGSCWMHRVFERQLPLMVRGLLSSQGMQTPSADADVRMQ